MWSKTKKALESRLADGLKDRVYYTFAKYTYYDRHWDYVYPIFYIRVDKETWFATRDEWFDAVCKYGNSQSARQYDSYWGFNEKAREYGVVMATKELGTLGMTGYYKDDCIMEMVHNYLNVYTIEECLNHENYFYHILAVLDRRTGKRKIKKLLENIDSEPEWFRKYILLRANAENIHINRKTIKEEINESIND